MRSWKGIRELSLAAPKDDSELSLLTFGDILIARRARWDLERKGEEDFEGKVTSE